MTTKLRRLFLLGIACAQAAACDESAARLSDAATSMRSSTEQMASSSAAASDARQARIFAEADAIERRRHPELFPDNSDRYEVRQGLNGYSVYDRDTGRTVELDRRGLSGLSREQAERAAEGLRTSERNQFSPQSGADAAGPAQ